jgi:hypothetical protein
MEQRKQLSVVTDGSEGVELPASDRYFQKGMGLMALTWRRPAEIFFSASFNLPREKLPYPALLFDGQLENLARLPAPVP